MLHGVVVVVGGRRFVKFSQPAVRVSKFACRTFRIVRRGFESIKRAVRDCDDGAEGCIFACEGRDRRFVLGEPYLTDREGEVGEKACLAHAIVAYENVASPGQRAGIVEREIYRCLPAVVNPVKPERSDSVGSTVSLCDVCANYECVLCFSKAKKRRSPTGFVLESGSYGSVRGGVANGGKVLGSDGGRYLFELSVVVRVLP